MRAWFGPVRVCLAIALMLVASPASTADSDADGTEAPRSGRIQWFGELGYRWAQPDVPDGTAFRIFSRSSVGPNRRIPFDWDADSGYRISLGFEDPHGMGLRLRYAQLDTDTGVQVNLGRSDALDVFEGAPEFGGGFRFNGPNQGTTFLEIDTQVYDIEGTIKHRHGRADSVFSAGFRYAEMSQIQSVDVVDPDLAAPFFALARGSFDGFGPTFAAEVSIPFASRRSGFYVGGRLSYLFGESEGDGVAFSNGAFGEYRNPSADETVLMLDAWLGYQLETRRVRYRIGWQGEIWLDTGLLPGVQGDTTVFGLSVEAAFKP